MICNWYILSIVAFASCIGLRRCLCLREPKIYRFTDYAVKFKNFRVTLSLQIHCLKSVGAKAPMGNCLWHLVSQ